MSKYVHSQFPRKAADGWCLANFRPANFCLGNSLVAVNPVRNFDHENGKFIRKNMGKLWEQMMISLRDIVYTPEKCGL